MFSEKDLRLEEWRLLPCEWFGYVRCSANLLHQKMMIGDFSIFVKK